MADETKSESSTAAGSGGTPKASPIAGLKRGLTVLGTGLGRIRTGLAWYIRGLETEPQVRYMTVLWGLVFMFLGMSALSSANPFRLLVPGLAFPIPIKDTRPIVRVYAVERKTLRLLKVGIRMRTVGTGERQAALLAHAVTDAASRRVAGPGDLQPLPRVGLAVRHVWLRKAAGRVIVDLRKETVTETAYAFAKSRRTGAARVSIEVHAAEYLDLYFRALTATLGTAIAGVRDVEYLLDGQSARLPGMKFDLTAVHTAASVLPAPAKK